jgi:hypothetical protein
VREEGSTRFALVIVLVLVVLILILIGAPLLRWSVGRCTIVDVIFLFKEGNDFSTQFYTIPA